MARVMPTVETVTCVMAVGGNKPPKAMHVAYHISHPHATLCALSPQKNFWSHT